ncbi:transposase [Paenibacillus allorhizosphaerae]|uniref:transposase n=1 Tax=Paenibacillus allorhizosphaerae TaxID=2849866 RepID=UPI002E78B4E8|nr:transposase [Paenibacillus allorhizosphaerae]
MQRKRRTTDDENGSQFPSAAHLCTWVGIVPGHNESAGIRQNHEREQVFKIGIG